MTINDLTNKFTNVEIALKNKTWFKKDGWISSTHPFPKKNPSGVTFHVYKKHWFNDDAHGIHIESYLDLDVKKRKKAYLTIHFLHDEIIPGTKLKRSALTKPIIDNVYETMSEWAGYKFRVGKYGQQPFTLLMDGMEESFSNELATEVTRLCKTFGPLIDNKIMELKKGLK